MLRHERFCIIERSPGSYEALYMVDTHPEFRQRGCRVRTYQELIATPATASVPATAFRADCSGSSFDEAGHRVFGPSARRLDRFAAFEDDGALLVNTRELVCAEPLLPEAPCVLTPK